MNKKEHTAILIWIFIKLICIPSQKGRELTAVNRLWRTGKSLKYARKSESVCVHVCIRMDNPGTGFTAFIRFSQEFMNNKSLKQLFWSILGR